ncbi:MAG: hypothetical protein KI791_10535 [Cyclobacteriaceae bacterium]|nr:hypothetical protein [Cyclobacteriaceae bacterium SS2]
MKRVLFLFSLLVGSTLMAQEGSVGIGTQTPNDKAVLHLVAPNNDQGFLVPKLTTTQRNNFSTQLTSTENGMMVFDSDLNQFFFWLTDHWEAVGLSVQAGNGVQIVDGVITNTGDTDASDDFSGDWGDLANIPTEFVDGTDDVDDADADPANELQDLNLAGNILTISGLTTPTQIDLTPYSSTNTDEQDLQFSAGQISLTGDPDNTIIDLSGYDTDASDDFSGDWADLQNVPAAFLDGTDEVDDADNDPTNEIELPATAGTGEALKFDGANWVAATDETDDADNDPGNELQDLSLSGSTLSITGLSTPTIIDLAPFLGENTDNQDLQFSGGQISLSGDPDNTIIDLSNYDSDVTDDFSGSFLDLLDVPINLDLNALDDFSGSFLDLADVPVNLDLNALDDFSGSFLDLTDIPINLDLDATDDFSGLFSDLTGIPVNLDLDATDDFSGSFEDLLDIPFYLDMDVTDDFSGSFLDLTDVPVNLDLDGTDDFSGSFLDLSDVPVNLDLDVTDDFSGSFLDLTDIPANLDLDATDDFSGEWGDLLSVPGDFLDGTDDVDDADSDPSNEFQDLIFNEATKTLSITNDPDDTPVDLSGLIDVDITDLLFTLFPSTGDVLKYQGLVLGWRAAPDEVDDADADPNNERQDLFFDSRGYTLNITDNPDATLIDLSGLRDNTDQQDLELLDGSLVLTNDDTPVNLSAYFDNTDLLASIPVDASDEGSVLKYFPADGGWQPSTDFVDDADNDPTNENQTVSAGSGINVTQSGQNFQVTNTLPDRTVIITGSGNATVTGTYPNFNIDVPSSGGSGQYAFKAGKTINQSISFDGKTVGVPFDAIGYDIGGNYERETSSFIAPVAGIYNFSGIVSTTVDGGADLDIYLLVNGSPMHAVVVSGGGVSQNAFSFVTDLQLSKDDRVEVGVSSRASGTIVGKATQTNWSGRLVMEISK